MEKSILEKLDTLLSKYKSKPVYVVEYKGENLVLDSGKSAWSSIGAAKNAIRHQLPSLGYWRTRLEVIKELEGKEIIKYVKL